MNTGGMATAPLNRADSKALTRTRILEAARRVFERQGFHGSSLDQVAREAGFTKGAVYSAFDSKADLFLTLLAERATQRQQAWEAMSRRATSPEAFVAEVTGGFAQSVSREREWWAAVIEFATFVARDEALRAALRRAPRRDAAGARPHDGGVERAHRAAARDGAARPGNRVPRARQRTHPRVAAVTGRRAAIALRRRQHGAAPGARA